MITKGLLTLGVASLVLYGLFRIYRARKAAPRPSEGPASCSTMEKSQPNSGRGSFVNSFNGRKSPEDVPKAHLITEGASGKEQANDRNRPNEHPNAGNRPQKHTKPNASEKDSPHPLLSDKALLFYLLLLFLFYFMKKRSQKRGN